MGTMRQSNCPLDCIPCCTLKLLQMNSFLLCTADSRASQSVYHTRHTYQNCITCATFSVSRATITRDTITRDTITVSHVTPSLYHCTDSYAIPSCWSYLQSFCAAIHKHARSPSDRYCLILCHTDQASIMFSSEFPSSDYGTHELRQ
jgi:hypothetical protein